MQPLSAEEGVSSHPARLRATLPWQTLKIGLEF